jgi:hypothetical protein
MMNVPFTAFLVRVSQLLIEAPFMAERVDELSVSRAPEHILDGHLDQRPAGDSALNHAVRVINTARDPYRSTLHASGEH